MSNDTITLTLEEAAAKLGVSKSTARKRIMSLTTPIDINIAYKDVYNRFDTSRFAVNGYRRVRYMLYTVPVSLFEK